MIPEFIQNVAQWLAACCCLDAVAVGTESRRATPVGVAASSKEFGEYVTRPLIGRYISRE